MKETAQELAALNQFVVLHLVRLLDGLYSSSRIVIYEMQYCDEVVNCNLNISALGASM